MSEIYDIIMGISPNKKKGSKYMVLIQKIMYFKKKSENNAIYIWF